MNSALQEAKKAVYQSNAEKAQLAKDKSRLQQLDRQIQTLESRQGIRTVDTDRQIDDLRTEREEVEARIQVAEEEGP